MNHLVDSIFGFKHWNYWNVAPYFVFREKNNQGGLLESSQCFQCAGECKSEIFGAISYFQSIEQKRRMKFLSFCWSTKQHKFWSPIRFWGPFSLQVTTNSAFSSYHIVVECKASLISLIFIPPHEWGQGPSVAKTWKMLPKELWIMRDSCCWPPTLLDEFLPILSGSIANNLFPHIPLLGSLQCGSPLTIFHTIIIIFFRLIGVYNFSFVEY